MRVAGIAGAAASGGCTRYDTFFERERRVHLTDAGVDPRGDPPSMADISSRPPPLRAWERRSLLLIVGLSLIFSTWSIWWGLPAMPASWAPDEFSPLRIHHGLAQRFSNGWFELYPPFHVYLLALVVSPIELFAPHGLGEMADPASYTLAFYLMRLVSVGMAAALVLVVFELGRELFDVRSGLFAALSAALMVPLVYYAKLANVEIPYLFWFALSLLFYIRILASHRMKDYIAFALAAAFAMGTKDQAYGFYLAMPFTIAASDAILRRGRGMPAALWRSAFNRRTFAVLGTGAAALALVHNLVFNWNGAAERLRIMTGQTTQSLQEFPNTVAGHVGMLALGVRHVQFALGWPLFAASLAGLAIIGLRWRQHPRAMALLPPIATYWVFLILPIMYHYDRYLLPVAVILSLFAGAALARLTQPGGRFAALRQGIAIAVVVHTIASATSVNVLLAGDARYAAERWLHQNLAPGSRVMAVGYPMYLPRFANLDVVTCLRPTLAMLPEAPDYIVLTSVFEEWRFADDPEALRFFKALKAGRTPYQLAFSYRARPALNLVDIKGVRTNLDKINPRIRIYRRESQRGARGSIGARDPRGPERRRESKASWSRLGRAGEGRRTETAVHGHRKEELAALAGDGEPLPGEGRRDGGGVEHGEWPRVAFDALLRVEKQVGDTVHAPPGGVIDKHRRGGDAAQLGDELPPVVDVRQQAIAQRHVEGAIRVRQREQVSDVESDAAVQPGSQLPGARRSASEHRHVESFADEHGHELRVPAPHVDHTGAARNVPQQLGRAVRLAPQEQSADRAGEPPRIFGRRADDIGGLARVHDAVRPSTRGR